MKQKKIFSIILAAAMVMTAFTLAVNVSASADEPFTLDYTNEVIIVDTASLSGKTAFYALNAGKAADAVGTDNASKTLDGLKWFPVYGGKIDISKVIPKKAPGEGKTPYTIALKVGLNGMPIFVQLKNREAIKEILNKTSVTYNAATGTISAPSGAIEVKVNNDSYHDILGTGAYPIYNFPSGGGAVQVRIKASGSFDFGTTTDLAAGGGAPASAAFKLKIAAQPKAPKVVYDAGKGSTPVATLKGLNDKMEISLSYDPASTTAWKSVDSDYKNCKVASLTDLLEDYNSATHKTVYVRTAASEKNGKYTPFSAIRVIPIG